MARKSMKFYTGDNGNCVLFTIQGLQENFESLKRKLLTEWAKKGTAFIRTVAFC